MVDGIINSSFFDARPIVNFPSPLSDMSTILPIDAIQEFNLEENPKAEYGWKPGAVVNVGIRSGTNAFHGSAYAFGRNGSWDARSVFNPAPNPVLPVELEQFGGVAGGPVKKDKLFFFAGYEGLRSNIGNFYPEAVPATGPGLGPQYSMVDAINALHAGCRRDAQSHQPQIAGLHFGPNRLYGRPHPGRPREHDCLRQYRPHQQYQRQRSNEN
jgi:hypothetical protein